MQNVWYSWVFITILVKCSLCQYEEDFLPKNVKPLRYNLTVEPKLKETNFTKFYGSILIDIEVLEDTYNVTLHARNLTIDESTITITNNNNENKTIVNTLIDDVRDFYILRLDDSLKRGEKWKIRFGFFSGLLTDTLLGFYLVKYQDEFNKEKYVTVTELQSLYARKVFPCFDEPSLKATFIVSLVRPNTSMSASNTELQSTINLGNGLCKDTFKETKLMSTYLLAFIISEYKYTVANDRVRILVRPEFLNDTDYILSKAPKLFRAMEEYVGLPYALNKMDLVGIPNGYFLDGAMENWGLVVYAEKYLVCSNTSLLYTLQKCAGFTAHEMAHQWFGNLATPKKWNYMWLSEGFSTFFQYYITDKVEPSWRMMEQYVLEEERKALVNDVVPDTEPINFIFKKRKSFPSPYIYYCKASAVIRMVQHVLSEDVFQKGLRIYLKQYQFNSAEPKDLYNALEEAVKDANVSTVLGEITVTQFFDQWTEAIGHPIITVTRDYENGTVTFTQEKYRHDNGTDNSIWYVPISYMTNQNIVKHFLLLDKSATVKLDALDDWVLVNLNQTGFYRVNYDEENWKRLSNFLRTDKFTLIPPVNRMKLLSDCSTYILRGFLSYDVFFNLTTYIAQETDYIPLQIFFETSRVLQANLKEHDDFKNYLKKTIQFAYNTLGVDERLNDTHTDKLTRIEVLNWMCRYQDHVCQKTGLEILQTKTFDKIGPNLEFSILCGGIQNATMEEWMTLLEAYYTSTNLNQQNRYITALSCTRDPEIITHLLDTLFDVHLPINPDDRTSSLLSLCKNSALGLNITLDYLVTYKHEHYQRYNTAFGPINELVAVPYNQVHQLEAIKTSGRLHQIPLKFYLLKKEEQMPLQFLKWFDKYRNVLNL